MRDEKEERSKIFTGNNTTTKKAMGISTAAVLIALSFVSVLSPITAAFAQTVQCGDTITKSTTLTSDIGPCSSGDGINIGADNIILDCRGHSITSDSGNADGIYMQGHSGVTITNCKSIGFENGFKLVDSSHNTLRTNIASKNSDDGFDIQSSTSNTLTANTASENSYGFYLPLGSDHNILKLNTASNTDYGFIIPSSSNTLTGNTARDNQFIGFELYDSSSNNILNTNTASNDGDGFYLYDTSSNTLTGNKADANSHYGFQDESQGTGTKGTANIYRLNECHGNGDGGSSPTGLCRPQS